MELIEIFREKDSYRVLIQREEREDLDYLCADYHQAMMFACLHMRPEWSRPGGWC